MRYVAIALALLAAGCGPAKPKESDVRSAVGDALGKYGELVDFSLLSGAVERTDPGKPQVRRLIPYRAAVRLRDRIFWEEASEFRLKIGDYIIPGELRAYEDLHRGARAAIDRGEAVPRLTLQPAGSIYVQNGAVAYLKGEKEYSFAGVDLIRRGVCPPGPAADCFRSNGIPGP